MTEQSWSAYDRIAGLYDEDMGANNPGRDIAFYLDLARRTGGSVLELGCGTGRITLPLIQDGAPVTGLDGSTPMLTRLRFKATSLLSPMERRKLHLLCADMRAFALRSRFTLIICPFSTFTYNLERQDQRNTLDCVRRHLEPGGRFALDLFVYRREFLEFPDNHVFFDYRRARSDGTFLQRSRTIEKDPARQINSVRREYTHITKDGQVLESFATMERIRYFHRDQMHALLEEEGFEPLEEYGGFEGNPYSKDGDLMVFVYGFRRGKGPGQ